MRGDTKAPTRSPTCVSARLRPSFLLIGPLIGLLACGGQEPPPPPLIVGIEYPRPINAQECLPCNLVVHMSPDEYAQAKYLWQYDACTFHELDATSRFIDCRQVACGLVPIGLRRDACGWSPP